MTITCVFCGATIGERCGRCESERVFEVLGVPKALDGKSDFMWCAECDAIFVRGWKFINGAFHPAEPKSSVCRNCYDLALSNVAEIRSERQL